MHKLFRMKAYEAENGPHFDEEHARKAVSKMENEDGSKGQHYSIEEAHRLASQYGVALGSKVNKYDWYVALNMVYSDFYKAIVSITGSANNKHFVDFAKAWLMDKDVDEGKMWFYYIYVMKDDIREEEVEMYEECEDMEDEDEPMSKHRRMSRARYGGRVGRYHVGYNKRHDEYDDDDDDDEEYEPRHRRTRSVRYMRY